MITSVQNERVKKWNKLKKSKERKKSNTFLIEGYHLVEEAIKSNWNIKEVIMEEGIDTPSWIKGYDITDVSSNVFNTIADTKSPQGIAAVVEMKKHQLNQPSKLLLIDTVQDPGNLGTMIRTADAAGFDGIILGDGTVDLYNDKVIRATQGSIFHLPILQKNLKETIIELKEQGFDIWASTLKEAVPYSEVPIQEKLALIVGNEGAGIDQELIKVATKKVHIPIYGKAESLNVSVASGILIYYIANEK